MNFELSKKDGIINFENFVLNDTVISIRKLRWYGDFTLEIKYQNHFEIINFGKNIRARNFVWIKLGLDYDFSSKLIKPVAIWNDYHNYNGEYLGN